MQLGRPRSRRGWFRRLPIVACFAILGWLLGRRGEPEPEPVALAGVVLLALALGVIGRSIYGWAMVIFHPAIRRDHGAAAIRRAVDTGFLMLIPFTVLAAFAELRLGWSAVQAFASAGLMISGAMAGAELAKLGKQSWFAALLPCVGAAVFAAAWMLMVPMLRNALPLP